MQILLFIIILGILVFVHELGHFLFAKWRGVRVEEFGFGYPPRAKRLGKIGETEYSLNWIPFGGFVKMSGEDPEGKIPVDPTDNHNFVNKKPWEQILILVAGALFNWLFAFLLVWMIFWAGIRVPIDSAPAFGNLEDIRNEVVVVAPGSPAETAGVEAGDQILSLGTGDEVTPVSSDTDILEFINNQESETLTIVYESEGEEIRAVISPEEGIVEGNRAIGVAIAETGLLSLAPHEAFIYGAEQTWHITRAIAVGLYDLIKNLVTLNLGGVEDVSGPVGIVRAVGSASEHGMAALAYFVALISINLALLNLVPFPALDGGRILFTVIEWIKGSRINSNIANLTNVIGFYILILLMLIVTIKDVLHLF